MRSAGPDFCRRRRTVMTYRRAWRTAIAVALGAGAVAAPAGADTVTSGATSFSFGQLQAGAVGATGCGTNTDGEPAIHVSRAGNVFLGSERGLGGGSDLWRA